MNYVVASTGVQLVLQEYDFSAKPTFTEDDIASLQPLVKHTNFRVCEGTTGYVRVPQGM